MPELFGTPADRLGAESRTSGVNLAARMVIMKCCVKPGETSCVLSGKLKKRKEEQKERRRS